MDPNNSELLEEQVLLEAFRELRPSRDDFAEDVRARIAAGRVLAEGAPSRALTGALEERAKRDDETLKRARSLSPFVRRAAAFLPPSLLAGPAAANVALQGGAKGLGAKGLAGFLSFPAMTLIAVVMTVFTLIQKLRRVESVERNHSDDNLKEVRNWWAEHRKAAILVVLSANALIWYEPAISIPMYFGISAAAVVLTLVQLQAAGFGSREVIRKRSAWMLLGLGCWISILFPFVDSFRRIAFMPILCLGAFFLLLPALRRNPITAQAITVLFWLVAPFALILGLILAFAIPWDSLTRAEQTVSREHLVAYVEQFPSRTANTAEWQHWGFVTHWLMEAEQDLDLEIVRAGLLERIDAGEKLHPATAYSAWSRKVLHDSELREFLNENPWIYRGAPEVPDPPRASYAGALNLVQRLQVDAEFTSKARSAFGTRIGNAIPEPGAVNALSNLWWYTEMLDLLEHSWLFELRDKQVREVVAAAWLGTFSPSEEASGFSDSPGQRPEGAPLLSQSTATWIAAALMDRCGVPESVDLERLMEFTVESGYLTSNREPNSFDLILCAAKERLLQGHPEVAERVLASSLERHPTRYSPNWWGVQLMRRLDVIAALALVALCFWATYRCPEESEVD